MNGSRQTPSRPGDRSSLDALSRTIEGLEARIEGLMGSTARGDYRTRPQPEPTERPARRDSFREREPQGERFDPLAEIRQRQRMLDAGRERQPAPAPQRPQPPRHALREEPRPAPRAPQAQPHAAMRAPVAAPAMPDPGMNDIAQALVNLRHELKQDISQGLAREAAMLREEMRSIRTSAENHPVALDMRDDLARLAAGIDQLGHQSSAQREADSLRAEFEELRAMMDGLAREDSIRHMHMRWNGVEDKLHALETGPLQEELVSLAYRLDDIKMQLGSMRDSPAIHALEDKLMRVAHAVETLGERMPANDHGISEQFAGLDLRLDEISRAIAATSRAAAPADNNAMQRLENRLSALAEQIDTIGRETINRPDPAAQLGARIEALTARVEDMAHQEAAMRLDERLEQLSLLMERSQKAPAAPELTDYLADISRKIDALEQGSVNDVLAERLDYLARRIEEFEFQPQHAVASPHDDAAMRRIEGQLNDIAARLDETTAAPAGDHSALRALEDQIAHLSQLISEPRAEHAVELPAVFESRLSAIEDYMATNDEYIIEAARHAAEAVVEAYSRGGISASAGAPVADVSALAALADDLRHLEDLSRGSEERTQQTFEALHDTLVQIAGRLEDMDGRFRHFEEDRYERRPQPVMPKATQPVFAEEAFEAEAYAYAETADAREPARDAARFNAPPLAPMLDAPTLDAVEGEADTARLPVETPVTEEARPGLFANLGRKFRTGRNKAEQPAGQRATIEPTPPLAPEEMVASPEANELLEPGSGAPDIKRILERVRAMQNAQAAGGAGSSDGDRADYIAAARRAAQAAAQEIDQAQKSAPAKGGSALGSTIKRHRRPILMAVGAILLAVMALPLAKNFIAPKKAPAAVEASIAPAAKEPAASEPAAADTSEPKQAAALAAPTQATPPVEPATDGALDADGAVAPAAETPAVPAETTTPMQAEAKLAPAETAPAALEVPDTITPKALADAARNGDALALFEIGARYTEGRGVKSDLAAAAKWYTQAADKGFAPAQYRIANLFEKGTGVERDLAKARHYYEAAAAQGNASAMHNLAVLLATGAEGKPDFDTAVGWFTKAADLGVADSQFNLAILYARGNGVKQDLEESYKWFAIAAKDGDKDAAQKRDEVANAMRPEQLESARAKVDLWKPQPLDQNANSVDLPDAWVGKAHTTASVDMKKAVRNIQAILNNNGFDAGPPDGEMGKKTVNAIKAFQKSVGMETDGKVSDRLVKELLARNK
ncbi:peptidoglycan-binding protein [Rhizobium sp. YJ-22]|uniref:peptidoglycan-binding protein n=1 Tax=Rhizobium sp. YJ-22 TaxID=3037556 RepID=UPI0024123842|nr:peptidoglycan-binding protein [Rhizobium sp. YJ-22]MDG3575291.1 peptidoglycan-binding protein [Rhizobium sp. YJ-22]